MESANTTSKIFPAFEGKNQIDFEENPDLNIIVKFIIAKYKDHLILETIKEKIIELINNFDEEKFRNLEDYLKQNCFNMYDITYDTYEIKLN